MKVIAIKDPMSCKIKIPAATIDVQMLSRPDRHLIMVPARKDKQWKESQWVPAIQTNTDLASILYLDSGLRIIIRTNEKCQLLCEYRQTTKEEAEEVERLLKIHRA